MPLGMILNDWLNTPWEEARNKVREELQQLRMAMQRQWGNSFDRDGVIRIEMVPAIPLDDNESVVGELPFSNLPDVTVSHLLGRGSSGSGEIQEVALGAGLAMNGTTLNATENFDWSVLTNGDFLLPELIFANGDVVMIKTPVA